MTAQQPEPRAGRRQAIENGGKHPLEWSPPQVNENAASAFCVSIPGTTGTKFYISIY
jgi:hypothetical protein